MRVKKGVVHPDFDYIPLGGWLGEVLDIEDDERYVQWSKEPWKRLPQSTAKNASDLTSIGRACGLAKKTSKPTQANRCASNSRRRRNLPNEER